jgi:hypothetical protein
MIVFVGVILGAISFASLYGVTGLIGFLALILSSALLIRARSVNRS